MKSNIKEAYGQGKLDGARRPKPRRYELSWLVNSNICIQSKIVYKLKRLNTFT